MTAGGRLARLLVSVASTLAPPQERGRFVREWEAELWHAERDGRGGAFLLSVAAGAFADGRALRTMNRDPDRADTLGEWTMGWGMDVKAAARGLLRSPAYAAVAVVTLGLGLGGTAAIYTLLDRVVLDPLPYPDGERLVRLENQVPGVAPDEIWNMSTAQFVDFQARVPSLEAIGLYGGTGAILETPSGPQLVSGWRVSHEVLPLLGARAQRGRLIGEDDDRPGAPEVALLSDGFWRQQLGADPDVVGRTVSVFGTPVAIVGVLQPGFRMPEEATRPAADLYVPLRANRSGNFQNNHVFRMLARTAPDADAAAVERDLALLTPGLPERFPSAYSESFLTRYGFRTQVTPLKAWVVGDVARNLWLLLAGVGLVLLIAAANVTNLFVVRMEGRTRELAVRSALGAGRAALARHLLAEAMVLSLAGAAVALAVAYWGVPALLSLAPDSLVLPSMRAIGLDAGGAGLTLLLALAVGLALVAGPLLSHVGPAGVAGGGDGRGGTAGRERQRLRGLLVVGQVALALTLVVGSALLGRSLLALAAVDPGFEPGDALALDVFLDPSRHEDDVAMWAAYHRVLEGTRGLPGVTAAGLGTALPLSGEFGCTVQGFEEAEVYERVSEAGQTTCAGQVVAAPGYFEALAIPVLAGRTFTDGDNDDPGRASVVVSRAFAERFWPGEDPLGKGVAPSGRTLPPFYRVVGVVGDVPGERLDGERAMAIYYPVVHDPNTPGNWGWWRPNDVSLVVRTAGADAAATLPAMRRVVASVDPGAPVSDARTLDAVVAASVGRLAFTSTLLAIAAAVALLLAAVGLYGVISYVVTRRTREIGLRMAMGARAGEVRRMVVGRSLGLVAVGLVLGLALSLAGGRLLRSLLYGVGPADPVALAGAALLLALVALAASWIPAHRASRVDPAEALRRE